MEEYAIKFQDGPLKDGRNGLTVEEAITEACIQLGLASTDVEVEVIEKGSAGFLGIGAKQAVIKAWKKQEKKEKQCSKCIYRTRKKNQCRD